MVCFEECPLLLTERVEAAGGTLVAARAQRSDTCGREEDAERGLVHTACFGERLKARRGLMRSFARGRSVRSTLWSIAHCAFRHRRG
mmetsp:Transcript_147265/g.470760  ORF Transcript_147265/g.470760 Transcript_147265/m.470760 type:complete len:87 (-) Transcript_147265:75-335(-)